MARLTRRMARPHRRRTEKVGRQYQSARGSSRVWRGERVGCLVSIVLYHLRSLSLLLGRFNIVHP